MNNSGEVKVYTNRQDLILALTEKLNESVKEKGEFHLSLSGGSTPKEWFKFLKNYDGNIPWEKIHLWWGDERCVPPDSAESNYGEALRLLLDHISIPEKNIHRILGELTPEEARDDQERQIDIWVPRANELPRFDLIILGLGSDGHTASIFPDQMEFFDSDRICEVATHPESGQKRITVTGPVLNNAEEVLFLVTGSGKAEIIDEIIHAKKLSEGKPYPADLIRPKSEKLIWMLDQDAAQLLE